MKLEIGQLLWQGTMSRGNYNIYMLEGEGKTLNYWYSVISREEMEQIHTKKEENRIEMKMIFGAVDIRNFSLFPEEGIEDFAGLRQRIKIVVPIIREEMRKRDITCGTVLSAFHS